MEIAEAGQAKGELIRRSVLQQAGRFTLGGLAAQLPGVSVQWIKKVLADLKREGRVQLEGRGRGAAWRVVR
jgi:predicted ArsR family transcriptional regulator